MAPRPGRKADETDGDGDGRGWLFAAGRFVGFALLAGMAVGTLALVVLLPEYARLRRAEYERDCKAADVADQRAVIAANERLIEAFRSDPVLTERYAINHLRLLPAGRVLVVDEASRPAYPPGLVLPDPAPRPEPVPGWLLGAADKLRSPARKRGLLVLAAGILLAAILLFAPPGAYRRKPAPAG